ncbi:hypothetical protein Goarm_023074 [Gossypium armourianum]|uniref:Uncharacterized protein n=1 Tax=Gossypium armourianum TaxID=34283 RepID=A0A7J9KH53_9ROSI|nr:hypothetical protein [Gossypium armourianum]
MGTKIDEPQIPEMSLDPPEITNPQIARKIHNVTCTDGFGSFLFLCQDHQELGSFCIPVNKTGSKIFY